MGPSRLTEKTRGDTLYGINSSIWQPPYDLFGNGSRTLRGLLRLSASPRHSRSDVWHENQHDSVRTLTASEPSP